MALDSQCTDSENTALGNDTVRCKTLPQRHFTNEMELRFPAELTDVTLCDDATIAVQRRQSRNVADKILKRRYRKTRDPSRLHELPTTYFGVGFLFVSRHDPQQQKGTQV